MFLTINLNKTLTLGTKNSFRLRISPNHSYYSKNRYAVFHSIPRYSAGALDHLPFQWHLYFINKIIYFFVFKERCSTVHESIFIYFM